MDMNTQFHVLQSIRYECENDSGAHFLDAENIGIIYEGTPPRNRACAVIVELFSERGNKTLLDHEPETFPKEFLYDLAVSMFAKHQETTDLLAASENNLEEKALGLEQAYEQIDGHQARNDELEEDAMNLEIDVEKKQDTIDDLNEDVGNLEYEVERKQATIDELNEDVQNLEYDVERKQATIDELNEDVQNLERDVEQKQATINDLEADVE
jgi:peptidoglycan hydrolase CwlO-like protein